MDSKDGCVGESFESCDDQDLKSLCVGRAFRAYFYEFKSQQNNSTYPGVTGGGYGMAAQNSLRSCCFHTNRTTLSVETY